MANVKLLFFLMLGFLASMLIFSGMLLTFDGLMQLVLAIFTGLMFWATKNSAEATERIAEDTKKSRRPYLVLEKRTYEGRNYSVYTTDQQNNWVKFPYVLKNNGNAAAVEIIKNHIVIRKIANKDLELISHYPEKDVELSIVPNDVSSIHLDCIQLKNKKQYVEEFRIEFHIQYKSDIPHDDRQFTSITRFILRPLFLTSNQYEFDDTKIVIPFKKELTLMEQQPFDSKEAFIKKYNLVDCRDE